MTLWRGVEAVALRRLQRPPESRSDRTLWFEDAMAYGLEPLLIAIWQRLDFVYVSDGLTTDERVGTVWGCESDGLSLLLRAGRIAPARQAEGLGALRHLVSSNIAEFAKRGAERDSPPIIVRQDVDIALFPFRSESRSRRSPFLVVDRSYLAQQRLLAKRPFVARFPSRADVVHGEDDAVKFLERDQTSELLREVREELIPGAEGPDLALPVLLLAGPPGSGKSTLIRRLAARLVPEGECVVADMGMYLSELDSAEMEGIQHELHELAALGRTVVLVLDDPIFRNSPWMRLLGKLAHAPRPDMVVLAASPRLLADENLSALPRSLDVRVRQMGPPSEDEQVRMAQLHHRSAAPFTHPAQTDFLAMAMEAAADEPFDQVIDGIWRTLNSGVPIPADAQTKDLDWRVRLYLAVCFFERHGVVPRLEHAAAIVALSGPDLPVEDLQHRVRTLVMRQGWDVFTVHDRQGGFSWWAGAGIGASHPSVARAAWARRPADTVDLGSLVASSFGPSGTGPAELGELVGGLLRANPGEGSTFVAALRDAWREAVTVGSADVRSLAMLVSAVVISNPRGPRFRAELEEAMNRCDAQSWIAALSIYLNTSLRERSCVYPPKLARDLPEIIRAADFALAQVRAAKFGTSLSKYPGALAEFIGRIEGDIDHDDAGLPGHLVSWYILNAPRQQVAVRLFALAAWCDRRSDRTDVRSHLVRFTADRVADGADRKRLLGFAQRWAHASTADRNPELWGAYARLYDRCADPDDAMAYDSLAATAGQRGGGHFRESGIHGSPRASGASRSRCEPTGTPTRHSNTGMESLDKVSVPPAVVGADCAAARNLPRVSDASARDACVCGINHQ